MGAAWVTVEKDLMLSVDKGNGVYLTLPWPAIYFYQFWLIIPTTVPAAANPVIVRRSTGAPFRTEEDWTGNPTMGLYAQTLENSVSQFAITFLGLIGSNPQFEGAFRRLLPVPGLPASHRDRSEFFCHKRTGAQLGREDGV